MERRLLDLHYPPFRKLFTYGNKELFGNKANMAVRGGGRFMGIYVKMRTQTRVPHTVRQTTKMRTQTRVPRTVRQTTKMRTKTRVPRTVP